LAEHDHFSAEHLSDGQRVQKAQRNEMTFTRSMEHMAEILLHQLNREEKLAFIRQLAQHV
jgi:hypothetical protein